MTLGSCKFLLSFYFAPFRIDILTEGRADEE